MVSQVPFSKPAGNNQGGRHYGFEQHFQAKLPRFRAAKIANIILLPKKLDATRVTDFRPISLIHSAAKLLTKLLANRLAPLLDSLVSKCQIAFIKKRSIHDNFLYV
jgi:hypothetical protein